MGDKIETLEYSTTIRLSSGSLTVSQVTVTIHNGIPPTATMGGVAILLPANATPVRTDTFTDSVKGFSSSKTTSPTTKSPPLPPSSSLSSSSPSSQSSPSPSSSTSQTSFSTTTLSNSLLSSITSSASTTATPGAGVGNGKHISVGGAAGVGVGSAIGGVIAATLIFLLLMRKSRKDGGKGKKQRVASTSPGRNKYSVALADYESTPFEFDDQSAVAIVERALPQPADDQALGGEMSKLRTLIKNHVQSYYHYRHTQESVDSVNFNEMEVAGRKSPISTSTLISLLANSKTRFSALRFYLSWITLQRIEPTCDPNRSFLPPEIARFLISVAKDEDSTPARMAFLSKWRSISAVLLQNKYGETKFLDTDARIQNISKGLEVVDSVLFLYADKSLDNKERLLNLEEILKRAARFGFVLFSQPSLWRFEWDEPKSIARNSFVIFPELQQIGDDNGQKMAVPRTVGGQQERSSR